MLVHMQLHMPLRSFVEVCAASAMFNSRFRQTTGSVLLWFFVC